MDMWDRVLEQADKELPAFNEHTMNHARQDKIKEIPKYLDMVFTEAAKIYGDSVKFIGHKVLTPEESYANALNNTKYTQYVDVTRSEMCLVEFQLEYNGIPFSIPIYIPYITEDCIIINGSRYYLMFALTDKIFYHIEKDHGIGIKVLRAHLRFWRNTRIRYTTVKGRVYGDHIVIAKIHMRKYKYISEDIRTALLLYPLTRFGFKGTLKKYGINPDYVDIVNFANEHDPDFDYFCVRPDNGENEPGLYLKVHQSVLDAQQSTGENRIWIRVIITLQYLLQYFVQCKNTIYTDNVKLREYLVNDPKTHVWRVILGKTTFGINYDNEPQAENHATTHLDSLTTYIDPETKRKLNELNVHCEDVYDLIHYVDTHIDEFVANYFPSNIYNKQLNIIDLLLGNITRALFLNIFNQTNNRKGNKPFEPKEIARSMRIGMKAMSKIYTCNGVIASNPSQYNDSYILTVGCRKKRATFASTDGGNIGKVAKKKSGNDVNLIYDSAHRLHSSMLYVESLSKTQNTDPTIGGNFNPFCPLNDFGEIIKAPWIEEILPLDKYVHTK